MVPGDAYEGDLTPDEGIDGVSQTDRMLLVVSLVLISGLVWAVPDRESIDELNLPVAQRTKLTVFG